MKKKFGLSTIITTIMTFVFMSSSLSSYSAPQAQHIHVVPQPSLGVPYKAPVYVPPAAPTIPFSAWTAQQQRPVVVNNPARASTGSTAQAQHIHLAPSSQTSLGVPYKAPVYTPPSAPSIPHSVWSAPAATAHTSTSQKTPQVAPTPYKDPYNAKIGSATGTSYPLQSDWRGDYYNKRVPNPVPLTGPGSTSEKPPAFVQQQVRVGSDLANPPDAVRAAGTYVANHKAETLMNAATFVLLPEVRVAKTVVEGASIARGGFVAEAAVRIQPKNLAEKLTLDEARAGAASNGEKMTGKIGDPSYHPNDWAKMEHVHKTPSGQNVTVHYWKNRADDAKNHGFKFKNK